MIIIVIIIIMTIMTTIIMVLLLRDQTRNGLNWIMGHACERIVDFLFCFNKII